jgi:hypothetical protein
MTITLLTVLPLNYFMFGPPKRQKYRQAQRSQTKTKGRRQPTEEEDGLAGNLTLTATTVPPLFASSTAESTPTTREAADRMKFEGSGLIGTPVESQAAGAAVHRYVSKESLLTIDDYIPVVGVEAAEPEDAEKEEEKVKDVEEEEEGDAGEQASKNKEQQRRKKQKQNERRRNRNKNRNRKKGQRQEQADTGKSIPAEPAT